MSRPSTLRAYFPGLLLLVGLVSGLLPSVSRGQDAMNADLEKRLRALEEQNNKLQKQVEDLQRVPTLPPVAPPPSTPLISPTAPLVPDSLGIEPHCRTTEIVDGVVKQMQAEAEALKMPAEPRESVVGSDLDMKLRWNHGLWAETGDKAFRIHIGGRTQFDTVWMDASDAVMFGPRGTGPIDDAMAFRRARFAMEGTWYDLIQFNMEYDFLNTVNDVPVGDPGGRQTIDTPVPTDLWVQFDRVPWLGHIRVGNQKDPISFEHITSSRFLNFMERSLGFDTFIGGLNNGFVPGVSVFNTFFDKHLFYQAAITKNNQTIFGFNVGDGETAYTIRLTGLPVWEQEGRVAVHLGVAYQYRDLDDHRVRLRSRTSTRNGPAALHSALIDFTLEGANQQLLVPEFVAILGPWTFQSEYLASWIGSARNRGSRVPGETAFYQSGYVEVLYMFTGEHRDYDRDMPRLGRVVPYENAFFTNGASGKLFGTGAWQLGLRYQFVDLDSLALGANAGTVHGLTVGLNWYLNPNLKIQWNYSVDKRLLRATDASDGDIRGFGIRVACDW